MRVWRPGTPWLVIECGVFRYFSHGLMTWGLAWATQGAILIPLWIVSGTARSEELASPYGRFVIGGRSRPLQASVFPVRSATLYFPCDGMAICGGFAATESMRPETPQAGRGKKDLSRHEKRGRTMIWFWSDPAVDGSGNE